MITFERAIDVAAPPARVWDVMSDGERWPEWTPSVTRVTIYGKPLAVGSRALIRQPKFPPAWWKVTALVPGQAFTWVSTAPGLRVVARHGVEPIPGGARATLRLSLDGWFAGWMARLTGAITERYLAYEAEGLKARSEDPTYHRAR